MKPGDKIRYHDNGAPGENPVGVCGTIHLDKVPDQAVGVVTQVDNSTHPVRADFGDEIGEWWIRRGFYELVEDVQEGKWMRALRASALAMKARISALCQTPDLQLSLGIRYDDGSRQKASVPVEQGAEKVAKRLFINETLLGRLKGGPGYMILAQEMNLTGFSHPMTLFGGFKVGEMAVFRPTYAQPRKWTHSYGVQLDGRMVNLPIQSGARALPEPPHDHPWSARHIEHIIRAGGDVEHLEGYGDEVIVTLPDTFPLVLCEH